MHSTSKQRKQHRVWSPSFQFSWFIVILAVISLESDAFAAYLYHTAVFDFIPDGVPEKTVRVLSSTFRTHLAKSGRMIVLSREDMDAIFKEQGLNIDEVTDQSAAVQFGKFLPSEMLIIGNISKSGESFHITARMVNIETIGVEINEFVISKPGEDNLLKSVELLARKMITRIPASGNVINQKRFQIWVDIGKKSGIRKGDVIIVERPEDVDLPGPSLIRVRKVWHEIALLKVVELSAEDNCICKITRCEPEEKVRIGDRAVADREYNDYSHEKARQIRWSTRFPGTGQALDKNWISAVLYSGIVIGALGLDAVAAMDYLEANDDLDNAKFRMRDARTNQEYARAFQDSVLAKRSLNDAGNRIIMYSASVAAVWLWNVVDRHLWGATNYRSHLLNGKFNLSVTPMFQEDRVLLTYSILIK